jgi:hypothetical protein
VVDVAFHGRLGDYQAFRGLGALRDRLAGSTGERTFALIGCSNASGRSPATRSTLGELARSERLPTAVVREICEGKLIREGYLHRKKRPKKDRVERLFLSPSGVEAMQRRKQPDA